MNDFRPAPQPRPGDELAPAPPAVLPAGAGRDPMQSTLGNGVTRRLLGQAGPPAKIAPAGRLDELEELFSRLEKLAAFDPTGAEVHTKNWAALTPAEIDGNLRYQEKRGADRDRLVLLIATVRAKIAGLTAADVPGGASALPTAKASFYHRLNALSPYYAQMGNMNWLSGNPKEAWERTCNLTSLAMTLEALGAGPADFRGDAVVMTRIAAHYGVQEPSALRLPDFLQLVAIYLYADKSQEGLGNARLPAGEAAEKITRARSAAAHGITASQSFPHFAELFGVTANWLAHSMSTQLTRRGTLHRKDKAIAKAQANLAGATARAGTAQAGLDEARAKLAGADPRSVKRLRKSVRTQEAASRRAVTRQVAAGRQLGSRTAEKAATIEGFVAADLDAITKHLATLTRRQAKAVKSLSRAKGARRAGLEQAVADRQKQIDLESRLLDERKAARPETIEHFETELDEALPVEQYRAEVLSWLRPALAAGRQVIASRPDHFVRVESAGDDAILVDDPAEPGKNQPMTWDEARAQGFFRWCVVLDR